MSHADAAKNLYRNLAYECDMAMALVDILLEEQACLVKLQTTEPEQPGPSQGSHDAGA